MFFRAECKQVADALGTTYVCQPGPRTAGWQTVTTAFLWSFVKYVIGLSAVIAVCA
jgi:hypothetical protein